ncbi:CobW family GTP-binding protein [Paenibacillus abyssi]|uniref:Cobalamin biosynthesis protein n=1 Tax=Paenibacillus abyssi TaxID=1340531 RepID=A0A917FWX6_9BACL|nr:GTP-binding protein [Paenibacillus abyssi]GGG09097.1 cobalamin biosynthesis protein [Paenibacillus abyssi]
MSSTEKVIPVHLISGFLGSGKTTLLTRLIDYYRSLDLKAAVIMNELGDVNLDGQLVGDRVPMSEMLSGCICCTIRGDLGVEIKELIDEHTPDVILIESTGAANPLEIIDGITETAMYARIDLRSVTTVIDGAGLLEMNKRGRNQTFRLMQEQIRCATHMIINKADRLAPEEIVEVEQLVREWNHSAPMTVTVKCVVDLERFGSGDSTDSAHPTRLSLGQGAEAASCGPDCGHDHSHHAHTGESHEHSHAAHMHESHEHVMVLTHYFTKPIDSHAFEAMLRRLPSEVYRAKGVVTFSDTTSRFLFQFAYREVEFIRITPQGQVNDVAVFIGEHFSKEQLLAELALLE